LFETREYHFTDKIFSLADVVKIAKIFDREKPQEDTAGYISYKIECTDNTSYESDILAIFDEDSSTSHKSIRELQLVINIRNGSRIVFRLTSAYERGELRVSGDNKDWVVGRFAEIKELIDSVQKQENWLIKYEKLVLHLSSICIGIIPFYLIQSYLSLFNTPSEPSENLLKLSSFLTDNPWMKILLYIFMFWLFGYVLASTLLRWVMKLWPKLEFDFGPEHLKIAKNRRKRLGVLLMAVILPILLTVFYDVIKSLVV
jgi:hypothetical protein